MTLELILYNWPSVICSIIAIAGLVVLVAISIEMAKDSED